MEYYWKRIWKDQRCGMKELVPYQRSFRIIWAMLVQEQNRDTDGRVQ